MAVGQLLVKQDIIVFILAHKQLTTETNISKKKLKKPNSPEANQLVIYKRGWEDELASLPRTNPASG